MNRETFKVVSYGGKNWRIEKYSPLVGSYIIVKLFSRLSGIVLAASSGEIKDMTVIAMHVSNELSNFTKAEFMEIQRDSLACVKEVTNVNGVEANISIVTPDGRFTSKELEEDVFGVLVLTTHVLMFNMIGFLDADVLKETVQAFKTCYLNLLTPST